MNCQYVGMRERCHSLGLAFKTPQRFGIAGELLGKNLDGDFTVQTVIPCPVDFTHASGPEWRKNFVRAEASAGR